MRSQQKKIEEQRRIIAHLRQQLETKEKSVRKCEIIAKSRLPSFGSVASKAKESCLDKNYSDEDMDDCESDSAINTDSGTEVCKLTDTDSSLLESKASKILSHQKPRKLYRSLSDLTQQSKIHFSTVVSNLPPQAVYANHRSVQRPRDVKNRHWRKSVAGFGS